MARPTIEWLLHTYLLPEGLHDHVLICIRVLMFLLLQGIQAHFLGIPTTINLEI